VLFLQAGFVIDQVNSKRSPDRLQDNYTKPFNKVNYAYKTSLSVSLRIFKIDIDHSNVTNSCLTIIKRAFVPRWYCSTWLPHCHASLHEMKKLIKTVNQSTFFLKCTNYTISGCPVIFYVKHEAQVKPQPELLTRMGLLNNPSRFYCAMQVSVATFIELTSS